MSPLSPGEIQARRRPLVVLAITGVRLAGGFVLAWPLASVIGASGVGYRDTGDRALFEGGGYLLLEVLRLHGADLAATARGLLPVLALGLVLTAACNAALLLALNARGRLQIGAWLARAWSHVPALVVLGVGVSLAQLLLILLGGAATGAIPSSMVSPKATTLAELATWAALAGLAGAAGGFGDVTRAALIRHRQGLAAAVSQAWRCSLRRPLRACFGWLPYALAFGAALLVASQLTERLDVSRPGAWRVLAVFALHQLVILSSVALRAAWYARALRLAAGA